MIVGPYDLKESWRWLRKYIAGPEMSNAIHPPFPAKHSILNAIDNKMEIVFFGDLMNLYARELVFGPELREWVKSADYIVVNLEGPLTPHSAYLYLKQRNDPSILTALKSLAPLDKFIFSVGNNHALDYGGSELRRCINRLREQSCHVIGTATHPSVNLRDKVVVAGATLWSNKHGTELQRLTPEFTSQPAPAQVQILYAHWGHEFELYPRPMQVREAQLHLKRWDAIIGHHSHCPQPIVLGPKPIAYSLGNFAVGYAKPVLNYGLTVKLTLGPAISEAESAPWKLGALDWEFTGISLADKKTAKVNLENNCPFFPGYDSLKTI